MLRLALLLSCVTLLFAGLAFPARAEVVLRAGDLVLVDSYVSPPAAPGVWRLDPTTLDTTLITAGDLLVRPDHIAVDRAGMIHVTDRVSGIVSIDPGTGIQTLLVPSSALGGRTARGICLADDHTVAVTTTGSGIGAVLTVDLRTRELTVISEGGLLENPACVAAGPGGTLYVGDQSANSAPNGSGSIVRVERSGAQSLFANGELFQGPFDIAIASDGWVWTAQWGWTSRRGGGFRRTRLSDGHTEYVQSDRSQGVAATPDGEVYLGDCTSISLDCYPESRFVHRFVAGTRSGLPAGAMAVVPAATTPVRRSTWGSLKTLYR